MMRFRGALLVLTLLLTMGLGQARSGGDQVWVSDIQANPSRFWNTTVTVVGQVRDVTANPAGTTRGTYALFDDSSPNPLMVRTRDLPPVGREYAVTGVIIQDPAAAGVPLLDELERADPGTSDLLRYMLIGGAVLFGGLLLTLVVLLVRPKRSVDAPTAAPAAAPPTPQPTPTRPPEPASFEPTRKVDSTRKMDAPKAPAGESDRTRVFTSLGVELSVEKGPDKGKIFALSKQVTTIGRPGARKNDVELSDDTVSKEQATIFYDKKAEAFTLTNQSNTNPTNVNDSVVVDAVKLEPGDVIQMGSTSLRFREEE